MSRPNLITCLLFEVAVLGVGALVPSSLQYDVCTCCTITYCNSYDLHAYGDVYAQFRGFLLPPGSSTPTRTDKQGAGDAGSERAFFGASRTSVLHVDPEASNAARAEVAAVGGDR